MCYHNLRLFIITPESSEWERNLRSFFRTRIKLLGLARENWEDKKRRREKRFSFCKPHFVKASFGFNFFHGFPFNFQSYLIYFSSQHLKTRAKRFSSSAFRLVSTSFLYLCLCKWKPLPAQGGCRYLRLRLFIEQKCKWKYLKNDIARHQGMDTMLSSTHSPISVSLSHTLIMLLHFSACS